MRPYIKYAPHATNSSWAYKDLCAARGMPQVQGAKGNGKLAIGELGGGWIQSDFDQFCDRNSIPRFTGFRDVSTDNSTNNSKDPTQDASGEVTLDGSAALAAYYFTFGQLPTQIDFLWGQDIAAITAYAYQHDYDVVSWSWGAPEKDWGRQALNQAATVVQASIQAGMTIFAAAGDNSSSDGTRGTNVDAIASVPGVIACGGTSWLNPNAQEVVWGDGHGGDEGTGGGYSAYFKPQQYQIGIPGHAPGKMVPDVADLADPNTGVQIVLNSQVQTIGGTSAVAPLWAGFLAALGPKLGKVYSKIWTRPAAFKDITQGSNGHFRAQAGPDPCTGLGTMIAPLVAKLLLN
jgi:kumamolisin